MADRFESRFRETAVGGPPDPAFAARLRALVVEEWRAGGGWAPPGDFEPDDHEGEIIMLETQERPPAGRAPAPTRRPPGRWLAAAAAVAVVAVIGGVVAMSGDDEDSVGTGPLAPGVEPPQDIMVVSEETPLDDHIEPGSYFIDPDGDPNTPLRVVYDVAAEGWSAWIGAAKFHADGHTGLSITTITNLTRDACRAQEPLEPAVGPTVDDLAIALTQLPPFEVTSAPRDITAFGYTGKHLQLTTPADLPTTGTGDSRRLTGCTDGALHTWYAPLLGGSFYGYNNEPGRSEDFWILDVDGTRLVIETNQSADADPQDLEERQEIFDSIRIEP